MKLKALFVLAVMIFCPSQPLHAATANEEHYDPQHTVLALNMAVVSIHRILSTNDRAVLEMEYRNIINNLKLGSIESDNEIISLYQELMNTISGKTLNLEAAKKLQTNYDAWAEKHITQSISGASGIILGAGKDIALNAVPALAEKCLAGLSAAFPPAAIVTIAGAVAVSCVSEYYAYQNAKLDAEFRRGLTEDMLRIDRKEHERYNALQSRLLDSSWRLLRQYHLPDEYRIVQSSIDDLFRAVNETDTTKRRGMFAALEKEFRIYPPYWIYRAEAEQIAGNDEEAAKCFDEFDKVWRPVLRNDLWKAEAEKFRVIEAVNSGKRDEALNHLEVMCENLGRSDWAENIFAGLVYYMLGENQKGIQRVEENVNFGFGLKTSRAVLAEMKSGKMDIRSLLATLEGLNIDAKKLNPENISPEAKLRRAELLLQEKAGDKDSAEYKRMADIYYSTKDYRRAYVWYYVYGQRTMYDNHGLISRSVLQLVCNVLSLGGILFNWPYNELDLIEGEGLFNLSKLSGDEIESARQEAQDKIKEIYAQRNAQIIELLTDSAYEGNVEAQKRLADMYYNGDVDLGVRQNFYYAYIWYYVSGQRAMYDNHGFISRTFLQLFYNIFSLGGLINWPYHELDLIEGEGLFNFGKLSGNAMELARNDAEKIIKAIQVGMMTGQTEHITMEEPSDSDGGFSFWDFLKFLVFIAAAILVAGLVADMLNL